MIMKKYLLLCISLMLLSCEPSYVDIGRDAYEQYFKSTLKDPESFKVYSEKYSEDEGGMKVYWEIDYGAKNSFGGLVREKAKFHTLGKKVFIDGTINSAD